MELGRLGVWYPTDRLDGPQLAALMATIEDHGYSAFWYPESRGYETLALAGFLLGASRKLVVGSSIANIYARDGYAARRGMITLNTLYGDRFILGLGVSHRPAVEGLRGHHYEKPLPAMRAYLDALQGSEPGAADWPVMIAALGPLMLKLTAERTKGALPYNVTPDHTSKAAALRRPGQWLAVEQKVCIEPDRARARALGRAELSRYMPLPNYRNNWLRLGFTEAELADGGSDRFIDAMVVSGTADEVKAGLRAHFTAGATHICLQPVHAEGDWAHRDAMIAALADT
ncbi:MAG: TIGR03620 family F420-dependent LLM class oxidoreductase [Acetobacteraceae bacterium]|nr:TIGR03620 family F420-dependent LLM class oxidoreductase [Acetobacteraceae bacterium]